MKALIILIIFSFILSGAEGNTFLYIIGMIVMFGVMALAYSNNEVEE